MAFSRSLAPLCLTVLLAAEVAQALEPARVDLRLGETERVGDTTAAAAVALVPKSVPALLAWPGGDLHLDVTLGRIEAGGGRGNGIEYVHVGPVWQYRPELLWRGAYVEIGTALTRLSNERVDGRELGGRWHLTSHLALGHRFANRRRWHLALRLQHASNAGTRSVNPGLDVSMLQLGYHF